MSRKNISSDNNGIVNRLEPLSNTYEAQPNIQAEVGQYEDQQQRRSSTSSSIDARFDYDDLDSLETKDKIPDSRFGDDARFDRLEGDHFQRSQNLDAPEPLPGMVQRWVDVSGDKTNYARKIRQGWRARPADTVPQEWQIMAVKSHTKDRGVIQVAEMVLMHMEKNRAMQIRAINRARTEKNTAAVKEQAFKDVAPGQERYGNFHWERHDVKESRRVPVADD